MLRWSFLFRQMEVKLLPVSSAPTVISRPLLLTASSGLNPEYEIRGVGATNMNVVHKVLKHQREVLNNYQLETCLHVTNLLDKPSTAAKTMTLVIPNDGYNVVTHQALIDTVDYFLDRCPTVKVLMPFNQKLEEHQDFDHVFRTKGIQEASTLLRDAIPIRDKDEIEPATQSLQLQLLRLNIKNTLGKTAYYHTTNLFFKLSKVCFDLEQYEEACYYAKQALKGYLKQYSNSKISSFYAAILIALGDANRECHRPRPAIADYEESLEILKRLYPQQNHTKVAQVLRSMGIFYTQQNDDRALTCLDDSLAMSRRISQTDQHVDIAEILQARGDFYYQQQKYDQAITDYKNSMDIIQNIVQTDLDLRIVQLLHKIGNVYFIKGDYDSALAHYIDSARLNRQLFGVDNHARNAETLLRIGDIYCEQGKYTLGLNYTVRGRLAGCTRMWYEQSTVPKLLTEQAARLLKPEFPRTIAAILAEKSKTYTTPKTRIFMSGRRGRGDGESTDINDYPLAIIEPNTHMIEKNNKNYTTKEQEKVSQVLYRKQPKTLIVTTKMTDALLMKRSLLLKQDVDVLTQFGKLDLEKIPINPSTQEIKVKLGTRAADIATCHHVLSLYDQKLINNGIIKILASAKPTMAVVTNSLAEGLALRKALLAGHGRNVTFRDNVDIFVWFGHEGLKKITPKPSTQTITILANTNLEDLSNKGTLDAVSHFLKTAYMVKVVTSQVEIAPDIVLNVTDLVNTKDSYNKIVKLLNNAVQIKTTDEATAYCKKLQNTIKEKETPDEDIMIVPRSFYKNVPDLLRDRCVGTKDTVVESYFQELGIRHELPEDFRFIPNLLHPQLAVRYPALLVRFVNNSGYFAGAYIKFFMPDTHNPEPSETKKEVYKVLIKKMFYGHPHEATVDIHAGIPHTLFIGNLTNALAAKDVLWGAHATEICANLDIKDGFSIKACFDIKYLPRIKLDPQTKKIVILMDNEGGDYKHFKHRLIDAIKHLFKADPKIDVLVVMPKTELGTKMPLTQVAIEDPDQFAKRILKATKIHSLNELICVNLPIKKSWTKGEIRPTKFSNKDLEERQAQAFSLYKKAKEIDPQAVVLKYLEYRGIKPFLPKEVRWDFLFHSTLNMKLPALIFPFFDSNGQLTGIHRLFCKHGEPIREVGLGRAGIKKISSKLALGRVFGSAIELYRGSILPHKPTQDKQAGVTIISEGIENALVIRDVMLALAQQESKTIQDIYRRLNITDDFVIKSCVGVSGLIGIPFEKETHTVVIVADNDGHNEDVKATLIQTVDCLLRNQLKVVIAMPEAGDGEKIDVNDIYNSGKNTQNVDAVRKVLEQAVSVTHIRQLGDKHEPLQDSLQRIRNKQSMTQALPLQTTSTGNVAQVLPRQKILLHEQKPKDISEPGPQITSRTTVHQPTLSTKNIKKLIRTYPNVLSPSQLQSQNGYDLLLQRVPPLLDRQAWRPLQIDPSETIYHKYQGLLWLGGEERIPYAYLQHAYRSICSASLFMNMPKILQIFLQGWNIGDLLSAGGWHFLSHEKCQITFDQNESTQDFISKLLRLAYQDQPEVLNAIMTRIIPIQKDGDLEAWHRALQKNSRGVVGMVMSQEQSKLLQMTFCTLSSGHSQISRFALSAENTLDKNHAQIMSRLYAHFVAEGQKAVLRLGH